MALAHAELLIQELYFTMLPLLFRTKHLYMRMFPRHPHYKISCFTIGRGLQIPLTESVTKGLYMPKLRGRLKILEFSLLLVRSY